MKKRIFSFIMLAAFVFSATGCDIKTDKNQTASDVLGIELSAKEVTPKGLTLVYNQSGGKATGDLQTGSDYELESMVEGQWKKVKTISNEEGEIVWNAIAYLIEKNGITEMKVDWSYLYGELSPGSYRLKKEIMDFRKAGDFDIYDYYVCFDVN